MSKTKKIYEATILLEYNEEEFPILCRELIEIQDSFKEHLLNIEISRETIYDSDKKIESMSEDVLGDD